MTAKFHRLFAILLLSACSSGGGESGETGSTGDVSTSGTGGSPVCGDDVVGHGEACDGKTAWTLRVGDPSDRTSILGVAVDPTGQIVVFGEKLRWPGGEPIPPAWLMALDPDGKKRWLKEIPRQSPSPDGGGVAVDTDGRIYVQFGGLQQFGPDGAPGWQVSPPEGEEEFLTVASGDGAVYTSSIGLAPVGDFEFANLIIHRHDPATGAIVWRQFVGDDPHRMYPSGMAVAGDTVAVVAQWYGRISGGGAALLSLEAATGAPVLRLIEEDQLWVPLAGLPSGELVIAGRGFYDWFVRRHDSGGNILWDHAVAVDNEAEAGITHLVVGPDETIVVAVNQGPHNAGHATVHALSGAGELGWTVDYAPGATIRNEIVDRVAFGPGFVVAVGHSETEASNAQTAWEQTGWIRKINSQ